MVVKSIFIFAAWNISAPLLSAHMVEGEFVLKAFSALQLKKVLSAIPEAPLNVECLMDDIDFRSSMTREKFEELAAPILDRAKEPVKKVRICCRLGSSI